jgi:uncharacterized coiled-coil protein SlyX
MIETILTISINDLTLLVAVVVFKSSLNKDKKEQAKSMDNRIMEIESEQKALKDSIVTLSHSVDKVSLTVEKIKDALNEINVNISLVQELKSTVKEFNHMLLGIDRVVTQHGVEIKNIRNENDQHDKQFHK